MIVVEVGLTGLYTSEHLHAEEVLAGVAPKQRPLRGLPLDDVGRHRHLAACDVHTQVLAHAPAMEAHQRIPLLCVDTLSCGFSGLGFRV